MLIHPLLRDVLPPDDGVPGGAVWLGVRWGAHDAVQGVFAVAMTLRKPIDRPAAPDAHEGPE